MKEYRDSEAVIREMKKRGYRITGQRKILVEIIMKDKCSCCKEIYYEALKQDSSIGMATVYRTVGALQDMGILRKDYHRQILAGTWSLGKKCHITLAGEGETKQEDDEELYEQVRGFLREKGYLKEEEFQVFVMVNE